MKPWMVESRFGHYTFARTLDLAFPRMPHRLLSCSLLTQGVHHRHSFLSAFQPRSKVSQESSIRLSESSTAVVSAGATPMRAWPCTRSMSRPSSLSSSAPATSSLRKLPPRYGQSSGGQVSSPLLDISLISSDKLLPACCVTHLRPILQAPRYASLFAVLASSSPCLLTSPKVRLLVSLSRIVLQVPCYRLPAHVSS